MLYKFHTIIMINSTKTIKIIGFLSILLFSLNGCNGKLPGGDARKFPSDPKKRVEKNLKEGRGFKLNDQFGKQRGGVFDFASSNELWRASLDVIDFMPLSSVNYSGGIIVTDWYSENNNPNESIKISIRFLTNEIRSDALNIKIFRRKCTSNLLNCSFTEISGNIEKELKKEILKKATRYKEDKKKEKEKS
jgi:hypothetical protein